MKEKTITLQNSNPFEFQDDSLFYRVVKGSAYLFAVEKMKNGFDSARTEIASYKEGDFILSIPPTASVRFVLTGTLDAQIEKIKNSALKGKEESKAIGQALEKASSLLQRGLNSRLDFVHILNARDRENAIREFAENLSKELCALRLADMIDENDALVRKIESSEKAFSSALEDIVSVVDGKKNEEIKIESHFPLVQAACLVADYDKIKLQEIQGKNYTNDDSLIELAKDSNIRIRSVMLKDKWWQEDNGALFGWYFSGSEDSGASLEPAALIPQKMGGYACILPESKKNEQVTEEIARHIHQSAYMFYRPLADSRISIKELFAFAFSSRKMMLDAFHFVMLGLISAVVGLLLPFITRIFIDSIIPQAAKSMAGQIAVIAFLCVFSAMVFDFIKTLAITRMEARSDSLLQAAVMDRLLKLPVGFFRDYTAGELSQKVFAISQIREIVFSVVISSGMTIVFSLVYLFQLFAYSKYLLGWGLLFCAVSLLVTALTSFFKYKYNKEIITLTGKISGLLFEFINGVNKLILTASEKQAFSIWTKLFARQNKSSKKADQINMIYVTFMSFFPLLPSLCFYGIFMNAVASGKMTALSTGSFLAFMASFSAFQSALIFSADAVTNSVQIIPMFAQAKTLLDASPEIQESKPAVSSLKGNIEINHISFRYNSESPLVLNDISMKIEPHEFVAIVGSSGSGKSTLVRILLGFEKAETGSVFFDNHDINSVDIGSIRRNMGVVLQNSSIMQGSIFENIIGNSSLTIEDAWRAAEMAGLADDIRAMPMGMHTIVTAGGGTFSGGQLQRLIIARAIARQPNILIFDEATSALDNKTQAQVSESLESLNVTRIVIAHRLSTIINADRIYVLNKGVIEECGTYEELMNKNGYFAKLAERQQA